MASKMWLLVEWLDENIILPPYSVVNVESKAFKRDDLQISKIILLRVNNRNPRRARIVRVSESKVAVNEQKLILEHQDHRLKNALQLCLSGEYRMLQGPGGLSLPPVVHAIDSDSSSDDEMPLSTRRRKAIQNDQQSSSASSSQSNRKQIMDKVVEETPKTSHSRAQPLRTSTPKPSVQQDVKTTCDQGTQTIMGRVEYENEQRQRLDHMRQCLQELGKQLADLGTEVKDNMEVSRALLEIKNRIDARNRALNDADEDDDEEDNEEDEDEDEDIEEQEEEEEDASPDEGVGENVNPQPMNNSNMEIEEIPASNARRLRRMSAHMMNNIDSTSNDDDMVPLGNSGTRIPRRLYDGINWNSPTMATRQLLQAVFPRSVLATHSLTGRQSPAFMNRPAKKILDPRVVEDIVKIVSTRCGVPRNLVRNTITIKCTDEAKLYRNRQLNMQRRKNSVNANDENRPPIPDSDESNMV